MSRRRLTQLVTPLDRCAEGALAFGSVARAVGQERQRPLEPREQRPGRKEARASSRKLDRQRQAVESRTDRLDRRVRLNGSTDCSCTLDEECDRVYRTERVEGVLDLAGDAQQRPARREHAKARGCGQEVGNCGSGS